MRFAGMMLFTNGSRMNRVGVAGSRGGVRGAEMWVWGGVGWRREIGEAPAKLRLARRDRARGLVLARDEVVDVRVVGEEEQLVAAVHEPRDDDRAAGGQRQGGGTPGLVA